MPCFCVRVRAVKYSLFPSHCEPSAAEESPAALCCPRVGKWGAGNGTSCSSQLPAGRAGLGRRNVSVCLPQTITTSKEKQPKAQVPELTLPHIQIRYLWSHHSPLNEPMRVWPLFYWVKTFSHGQMIRKLDAMGDKGQRKKSQQR